MDNNYKCIGNNYDRDCKCKSITKTPIEISTPVKIKPIVKVGRITEECGKPEICWCNEKGSDCKRACEFVIKQTIYVEIPICYDVETDVGESYVDCR